MVGDDKVEALPLKLGDSCLPARGFRDPMAGPGQNRLHGSANEIHVVDQKNVGQGPSPIANFVFHNSGEL
jgi:hypothetical protein